MAIVGGNESTRTGIAQGMKNLMNNPEQYRYLQNNLDKLPDAVDEIQELHRQLIVCPYGHYKDGAREPYGLLADGFFDSLALVGKNHFLGFYGFKGGVQ